MTSIKKNLIDNDNYRVSQSPDCDNLTKSFKARKREREGEEEKVRGLLVFSYLRSYNKTNNERTYRRMDERTNNFR